MNKKQMLAWSFTALLVTSWNSVVSAADTMTPANTMAQDPAMALANEERHAERKPPGARSAGGSIGRSR